MGTDTEYLRTGRISRGGLMVEYGMTPTQALVATTSTAAELMASTRSSERSSPASALTSS